MPPAPRVCIFGAGSIGCYLGGRLLAAGVAVDFVGRPRVGAELAQHGLTVSDLEGFSARIEPSAIRFVDTAEAAVAANLVLVTVKSAATADAARELAPHLRAGALVVSFQNGMDNAEVLRDGLGRSDVVVLPGMVPFNVVARGEGRFHRGSEGHLAVQTHAALQPWRASFATAGLPLDAHEDFRAVQWAKLLLNLNNAVNALSGLPLKAELSQRGYRRCVALAQREALKLLDAAGMEPAKLTPIPPHWLPTLLGVPDALFRRLANRMLAIDPLARSSMWEDLEAGRRTEIDWINGEVVKLARSLGRGAPVNARLIELVRAAEVGGRRDWSATDLRVELERAA